MLLPSFFIIDIDQFDAAPDVKLPENAFLCYRITFANRSQIDHFIQQILLLQRESPFCIMIDLHDDTFRTGTEFEQMTAALVSLSFHYKYIKLQHDNPLVIFDSPVENIEAQVAILQDRLKEQGYGNMETVIVNSSMNHDDAAKEKNKYFHLQQNNELFTGYHDLLSKITATNYAIYFFLKHPEILRDMPETINKVEEQFKKENPQAYYLLEENLALVKKEQEAQKRVGILEEQIESLKNYQNPSDSRYKRQITELLYFYKYEYEILPLWYKRFGHIIKVLRGQRTFKSLFRDNVKKYKN